MHQAWIQLKKKPLHPIIASAPLDLVHTDFTSIEVSGDDSLHTTPTVVPVLVITDHFTRHSMAFITKDQKASTVVKKLYENYICIFGAPTGLHSDQGANFTSTVIAELCSPFGNPEVKNDSILPPKQWQSEKHAPNSHKDDRQVAWPKESKLASTSTWSNTGKQQYSIRYYRLQPTLSNVWLKTKVPHQLIFPYFCYIFTMVNCPWEGFLVILVVSQMYQSWCHEILVTAPEIWEGFSINLYLGSKLVPWDPGHGTRNMREGILSRDKSFLLN